MRRAVYLLVCFVCLAASGCVAALTPAELNRYENHAYPAHTKGQVYKATVTALRSLGYELVVKDEASGRIKTAPKLITATAHGNAYGAVATENSFAWDIKVSSASDGAALVAEPRGYSGGQAVPNERIVGSYLKNLFTTLYGEIDRDL